MKKLIFLLLIIMLVLVLLIGCTKDEKDKGTNSIPKDDEDVLDNDNEKKPIIDNSNKEDIPHSFKEAISKLDLKTSINWEENESIRQAWIKRWMEFTFKDVDIQDLKTKNTYNQHKEIIYKLALRVEQEYVQFRADKDLQNVKKNDDGTYTVQIYLLSAYTIVEDGVAIQYLLDIVNCENYDDITDVLEYGLTLLDEDDRFAENIDIKAIFKNESILPDNVKAIATDKIIDSYELCGIYKEEDKLFILLTRGSKINDKGSMLNNLKLCYYDFDTSKFIEIFTLENLNVYNFYFSNKKGIMCNYGMEKFLIDFEGNISAINEEEIEYIYSPDEKYFAYADDRNLIIKNADSEEIVIKLEAVTDENLSLIERYSYGAYNWLDNENFIYTRGGWEWSAGFGIVNVNTLENIDLEESFYKVINRLEGKKLYVSYNPYGENYPFSYGHYNLDKTPYKYNDDFDVKKYPELYDGFKNMSGPKLLTSDSKYLYIFEEDGEKHEILLKEFSISEKKFVKEIKIVENQYLTYDYINYSVVLIENRFLAFFNRNFLYFIDLQNN